MPKQFPWFRFLLINAVLLYGTILLAYRGSRSAENLNVTTGRLQQATYQAEGSRQHTLVLLVQMQELPYSLRSNLGSTTEATYKRAAELVKTLQAASSVTAYFDPTDAVPLLYQLEADGHVLITAQRAKNENRVGSAAFFVLFVFLNAATFWNIRKQRKGTTKKRRANRKSAP